ncbi:MAG: hypothetical protein WC376_04250 [Candidatus Nanoarchaeia archaeon]|jgi:hypothetical protein
MSIEEVFSKISDADEKLETAKSYYSSKKISKEYFVQLATSIAKQYISNLEYNKAIDVLELLKK